MMCSISFEISVVRRAFKIIELPVHATLETVDVAFVCWRVMLAFIVLLVAALDGLSEPASPKKTISVLATKVQS